MLRVYRQRRDDPHVGVESAADNAAAVMEGGKLKHLKDEAQFIVAAAKT